MQIEFSLEHIGLAARNTTALKDWYERVLHARVLFTDENVPPAFFLQLPGGALIEIYSSHTSIQETSNNRLSGWRHLALRTRSIEVAKAKLESKGVVFRDEIKPAGGGGRVLFFQDLEGNLLHLIERETDSIFRAPE